jgi:hypothetical protein
MTNPNKTGLPYGSGSIQYRGNRWWITYRDRDNNVVSENSGSDRIADARLLLAERALAAAWARVERIKAVRNEAEIEATKAAARANRKRDDQAHDGPQPGSRGGSVRGNPARSPKRDSKKGRR